jgi:hypothetical protein
MAIRNKSGKKLKSAEVKTPAIYNKRVDALRFL